MNVSEISNWGSLTPEQILELKESGVRVPYKYLDWAETMTEKTAKPAEDVTSYEITDNSSLVNEAAELRSALEEQGVSLSSIAEIFIKRCGVKEDEVMTAIEDAAELVKESEKVGDEVAAVVAQTESEVNALSSKMNSVTTNGDGTADSNNEASDISKEIDSTIKDSTSKTSILSDKLKSIGNSIKKTVATANNAQEVADETIDIANNLAQKKSGSSTDDLIQGGLVAGTATAFGVEGVLLTGGLGATVSGLATGAVMVTPLGWGLLGATAIGIGVAELLFGGKKHQFAKLAEQAAKAGDQLNGFAQQAEDQAQKAAEVNGFTISSSQASISGLGAEAEASVTDTSKTDNNSPNAEDPKKKTQV